MAIDEQLAYIIEQNRDLLDAVQFLIDERETDNEDGIVFVEYGETSGCGGNCDCRPAPETFTTCAGMSPPKPVNLLKHPNPDVQLRLWLYTRQNLSATEAEANAYGKVIEWLEQRNFVENATEQFPF